LPEYRKDINVKGDKEKYLSYLEAAFDAGFTM